MRGKNPETSEPVSKLDSSFDCLPPKILIVSDDDNIKEVMIQCISNAWPSAALQIVGLGMECLENIKQDGLDLIILDSPLDDMNRWQVLQNIRELSNVPVLLLSHLKDEYQIVKALSLGADSYMVKPVQPMEAMARIKALLRRKYPNIDRKNKRKEYQAL
jgi:DNA-binding response OmpR family regulator